MSHSGLRRQIPSTMFRPNGGLPPFWRRPANKGVWFEVAHLSNSSTMARPDLVRLASRRAKPGTALGDMGRLDREMCCCTGNRFVRGRRVGRARWDRATRDTNLALLPIGYADACSVAGRAAEALINGRRCPGVGGSAWDWSTWAPGRLMGRR